MLLHRPLTKASVSCDTLFSALPRYLRTTRSAFLQQLQQSRPFWLWLLHLLLPSWPFWQPSRLSVCQARQVLRLLSVFLSSSRSILEAAFWRLLCFTRFVYLSFKISFPFIHSYSFSCFYRFSVTFCVVLCSSGLCAASCVFMLCSFTLGYDVGGCCGFVLF